jgi:hypothetical protein
MTSASSVGQSENSNGSGRLVPVSEFERRERERRRMRIERLDRIADHSASRATRCFAAGPMC